MKLKTTLLTLLATLVAFSAIAQTGGVKGLVVLRGSRSPIDGIRINLSGAGTYSTYTQMGVFSFENLPEGDYSLFIDGGTDFQSLSLRVTVTDIVRDMGLITISSEFTAYDLDDADFAEFDMESGGGQAMPVLLSASKDIFDNISSYKFSAMRFRTRGYDSGTQDVYLNGMYFNDAITGYTPWSLWSGLNDATRNQEITSGLAISDYGVGGINGTTNINARASQMRKGFRSSVVGANNAYRFRVMATYASGELDNGWSYALSVSTRQGGNDWVNGLYYNSWGYFGSVERRLNAFNRLAFTFLGTPQERAVQAASTQEAYDLVGSNYYNPNWGYQGGGTSWKDMRSARVRKSHEPIAMLNYYYEPNARFNVQAAASYRFGKNGYSALDWYDAPDPRPDYYRNLPSYFSDDPAKQEEIREGWLSDWNVRQINWDRLYNVNYNSGFNSNIDYWDGVDPTGKRRSKYVIEERRTDQRDFNARVQIMSLLGDNHKINGGVNFRYNRTEYFKVLKDLLGGDYWLDIDGFAERDFREGEVIQNNLNTPNRLVKEGDKYGYDYYAHLRQDKMWLTYQFNRYNWDVYAAVENGHTEMWREGRYKKGLFPDNSYGKSEKLHFWDYTLKLGATYRISGSQLVYANIAYLHQAPYFQDAFVSPRTRNTPMPNMDSEKIFSADLNYAIRFPGVRARISGYYTHIKDRMDVISYWDDVEGAFSNFAMSGIDQKHAGVELGLSVPIGYGLTAEGALSYGYYIYSSNPTVTQTADNNERLILDNEKVYWKNMKIESTPQTAVSLGLRYRGPKNIFAGVDVNFYDAMYLSMSPIYRTDNAHQYLDYDASQQLAKQERFANAWVFNANVGKSWYVKNYNFGFSLEVKNLLNRQNIKTGGYEQMRLLKIKPTDEGGSASGTTYKRFGSKYFYMMGTTYYLNVYFRF